MERRCSRCGIWTRTLPYCVLCGPWLPTPQTQTHNGDGNHEQTDKQRRHGSATRTNVTA